MREKPWKVAYLELRKLEKRYPWSARKPKAFWRGTIHSNPGLRAGLVSNSHEYYLVSH